MKSEECDSSTCVPGGSEEISPLQANTFIQQCEELPWPKYGNQKSNVKVAEDHVRTLLKLWIHFKSAQSLNDFDSTDPDRCLESLLICTSRIIFNIEYSKSISSDLKKELKEVILACGESITDPPYRKKLCVGISSIIEDPWRAANFKEAATVEAGKSKNNSASEALWDTEGWIMIESRIDFLSKTKSIGQLCCILGILVQKGHEIFQDNLNTCVTESAFHPYQFPRQKYLEYLEVYAIILYSQNKIETQFIETCGEEVLLDVISSLSEKAVNSENTRLFPNLKVWKHASEVIYVLSKEATWKALKSQEIKKNILEKLLSNWMQISDSRNGETNKSKTKSPIDDIVDCVDKIPFSDNVYTIAETVKTFFGKTSDTDDTIKKFVQLYSEALARDLKTLVTLKMDGDTDAIRILNKKLSLRYLGIIKFLEQEHPRIAKQSLLTAFSLNPCLKLYHLLFPSALSDKENTNVEAETEDDTLVEYYNELKSIDFEQIDIWENVNKSYDNVYLDLTNLIENPQYNGFHRVRCKIELQDICQTLMKSESVTVIDNKKLDYLNPDYDQYKDLKPQYDLDDDGIEKGYRTGEVLTWRRKLILKPKASVTKARRNAYNRARGLPLTGKNPRQKISVNGKTVRKGRPPKVNTSEINGFNHVSMENKLFEDLREIPNVCLNTNPFLDKNNYYAEVYDTCIRPNNPPHKEIRVPGRNFGKEAELIASVRRTTSRGLERKEWGKSTGEEINSASPENGMGSQKLEIDSHADLHPSIKQFSANENLSNPTIESINQPSPRNVPTSNETSSTMANLDTSNLEGSSSYYEDPFGGTMLKLLLEYAYQAQQSQSLPERASAPTANLPIPERQCYKLKKLRQVRNDKKGTEKERIPKKSKRESTSYTAHKNSKCEREVHTTVESFNTDISDERMDDVLITGNNTDEQVEVEVSTEHVTSTSKEVTPVVDEHNATPASIQPLEPLKPIFAGAFQILGAYNKGDKLENGESHPDLIPACQTQASLIHSPVTSYKNLNNEQLQKGDAISTDVSCGQDFLTPDSLSYKPAQDNVLRSMTPETPTRKRVIKTPSLTNANCKRRIVISNSRWNSDCKSEKLEEYKSAIPIPVTVTETPTSPSQSPSSSTSAYQFPYNVSCHTTAMSVVSPVLNRKSGAGETSTNSPVHLDILNDFTTPQVPLIHPNFPTSEIASSATNVDSKTTCFPLPTQSTPACGQVIAHLEEIANKPIPVIASSSSVEYKVVEKEPQRSVCETASVQENVSSTNNVLTLVVSDRESRRNDKDRDFNHVSIENPKASELITLSDEVPPNINNVPDYVETASNICETVNVENEYKKSLKPIKDDEQKEELKTMPMPHGNPLVKDTNNSTTVDNQCDNTNSSKNAAVPGPAKEVKVSLELKKSVLLANLQSLMSKKPPQNGANNNMNRNNSQLDPKILTLGIPKSYEQKIVRDDGKGTDLLKLDSDSSKDKGKKTSTDEKDEEHIQDPGSDTSSCEKNDKSKSFSKGRKSGEISENNYCGRTDFETKHPKQTCQQKDKPSVYELPNLVSDSCNGHLLVGNQPNNSSREGEDAISNLPSGNSNAKEKTFLNEEQVDPENLISTFVVNHSNNTESQVIETPLEAEETEIYSNHSSINEQQQNSVVRPDQDPLCILQNQTQISASLLPVNPEDQANDTISGEPEEIVQEDELNVEGVSFTPERFLEITNKNQQGATLQIVHQNLALSSFDDPQISTENQSSDVSEESDRIINKDPDGRNDNFEAEKQMEISKKKETTSNPDIDGRAQNDENALTSSLVTLDAFQKDCYLNSNSPALSNENVVSSCKPVETQNSLKVSSVESQKSIPDLPTRETPLNKSSCAQQRERQEAPFIEPIEANDQNLSVDRESELRIHEIKSEIDDSIGSQSSEPEIEEVNIHASENKDEKSTDIEATGDKNVEREISETSTKHWEQSKTINSTNDSESEKLDEEHEHCIPDVEDKSDEHTNICNVDKTASKEGVLQESGTLSDDSDHDVDIIGLEDEDERAEESSNMNLSQGECESNFSEIKTNRLHQASSSLSQGAPSDKPPPRSVTPEEEVKELMRTIVKNAKKSKYEENNDIKIAQSVRNHVQEHGGSMKQILSCLVKVRAVSLNVLSPSARKILSQPVKRSPRLKKKKARTIEVIQSAQTRPRVNTFAGDDSITESTLSDLDSDSDVQIIGEVLQPNFNSSMASNAQNSPTSEITNVSNGYLGPYGNEVGIRPIQTAIKRGRPLSYGMKRKSSQSSNVGSAKTESTPNEYKRPRSDPHQNEVGGSWASNHLDTDFQSSYDSESSTEPDDDHEYSAPNELNGGYSIPNGDIYFNDTEPEYPEVINEGSPRDPLAIDDNTAPAEMDVNMSGKLVERLPEVNSILVDDSNDGDYASMDSRTDYQPRNVQYAGNLATRNYKPLRSMPATKERDFRQDSDLQNRGVTNENSITDNDNSSDIEIIDEIPPSNQKKEGGSKLENVTTRSRQSSKSSSRPSTRMTTERSTYSPCSTLSRDENCTVSEKFPADEDGPQVSEHCSSPMNQVQNPNVTATLDLVNKEVKKHADTNITSDYVYILPHAGGGGTDSQQFLNNEKYFNRSMEETEITTERIDNSTSSPKTVATEISSCKNSHPFSHCGDQITEIRRGNLENNDTHNSFLEENPMVIVETKGAVPTDSRQWQNPRKDNMQNDIIDISSSTIIPSIEGSEEGLPDTEEMLDSTDTEEKDNTKNKNINIASIDVDRVMSLEKHETIANNTQEVQIDETPMNADGGDSDDEFPKNDTTSAASSHRYDTMALEDNCQVLLRNIDISEESMEASVPQLTENLRENSDENIMSESYAACEENVHQSNSLGGDGDIEECTETYSDNIIDAVKNVDDEFLSINNIEFTNIPSDNSNVHIAVEDDDHNDQDEIIRSSPSPELLQNQNSPVEHVSIGFSTEESPPLPTIQQENDIEENNSMQTGGDKLDDDSHLNMDIETTEFDNTENSKNQDVNVTVTEEKILQHFPNSMLELEDQKDGNNVLNSVVLEEQPRSPQMPELKQEISFCERLWSSDDEAPLIDAEGVIVIS